MLALIMAGGAGLRLNLGEKPLVSILGKPMIEYVIAAFRDCRYETVIATSCQTPYTDNWARALGYDCIRTSGTDYIRDLHEAVEMLGIDGPFFTCVSDIPCLLPDHVRSVCSSYFDSAGEALSVWVPVSCMSEGRDHNFVRSVDGTDACPAGINIIRGDLIARSQDEVELLVRSRDLAFNVNTREDLELVRAYLSDRARQGPGS